MSQAWIASPLGRSRRGDEGSAWRGECRKEHCSGRTRIQDFRINDRIRTQMVRLVEDNGETRIVTREEALEKAREADQDLVEVGPAADPPVCKLLDYGKFKYRQKKRTQHKHHRSQTKEIRIKPGTQEHDLSFKAEHARQFLMAHDKVLVTMNLTGRQKAHGDLALDHLKIFGERFLDIAKVERAPTRESAGRLSMMLSPK
ncbi:MAG: translation initiation factor IF-3 [Candidatus Brocadiia bacterium]|nr:translation initiation factor IF-3 [Candidatus Brocadiia bacterium]